MNARGRQAWIEVRPAERVAAGESEFSTVGGLTAVPAPNVPVGEKHHTGRWGVNTNRTTKESSARMKKISLVLLGLVLAAPVVVYGAGGVAGSPHDFSTNSLSWNTRRGVCSACHQAHHTDPAQIIPLWNHKTSTATFVPYTSPSMNASAGSPGGSSLACLSCHDGTVAINEGISGVLGTNGTVFIDPSAQIGPDLHTTHPISFVYDTALATADGSLEDPAAYKIGDPKPTLTVS